MKRLLKRMACCALPFTTLTGGGCDYWTKSSSPTTSAHQKPHIYVTRIPAKLRFGPIHASLELDLSEIKNIVLDAQQLYRDIVAGEPSATPQPGMPAILVVNKQGNKHSFIQLTPSISEIRLRNKESKGVELVVRNKEPLELELWVDSPQDVDVEVVFK